MIRAISFDAAGTLIHLAEPVGHGYARVAAAFGIELDPKKTTDAFHAAWKAQPSPDYRNGPASDGDRCWWRQLVESVLGRALPGRFLPAPLQTSFFDALYAHYALPETWRLYPEVTAVLDRITGSGIRLLILSNFDPRLRQILAGHCIAHHFDHLIISSEIGSYKPESAIFAKACSAAEALPADILHVGDDRIADIKGARDAGLQALHINRPETSLRAIFDHPNFPT